MHCSRCAYRSLPKARSSRHWRLKVRRQTNQTELRTQLDEDFFPADAHRRVAIGENGRLVDPPAGMCPGLKPVASGGELCALFLADRDIFDDCLQLLFVDARTHLSCRVQAVSDLQCLHTRHEFLDELPIHAFLDGDAACSRAALAARAKAAPDSSLDCEVKVRVVHH